MAYQARPKRRHQSLGPEYSQRARQTFQASRTTANRLLPPVRLFYCQPTHQLKFNAPADTCTALAINVHYGRPM